MNASRRAGRAARRERRGSPATDATDPRPTPEILTQGAGSVPQNSGALPASAL